MTLTLFDTVPHPRARARDTQTALDAAKSADRGVPAQILDVMRTEPQWSWTADELSERLPLVRQDTLRSALSRLNKAGRVRPQGKALSRAGCEMTCWRLS